MSKNLSIVDLENDLGGLQGLIGYYAKNGELRLLFDFAYPTSLGYIEELQSKLEMLNMYDAVKAALAQSEALARAGKYDEAEDVILEINRALMRASGTWDKMVKRFPPKEGDEESKAPGLKLNVLSFEQGKKS